MIHKLPFWTGAALGAGLVWLLHNRRIKKGLKQGKDYVSDKVDQGVATVKAVKACVDERTGRSADRDTAAAEQATVQSLGAAEQATSTQ